MGPDIALAEDATVDNPGSQAGYRPERPFTSEDGLHRVNDRLLNLWMRAIYP